MFVLQIAHGVERDGFAKQFPRNTLGKDLKPEERKKESTKREKERRVIHSHVFLRTRKRKDVIRLLFQHQSTKADQETEGNVLNLQFLVEHSGFTNYDASQFTMQFIVNHCRLKKINPEIN